VEIGHDVWQVRYQPAVGASWLQVEVLSFAQLRRMDREGRRVGPQRPAFHVLALVEAGVGRHRADFVDAMLVPQTVVWLRPGTVHAWIDVDAVQGRLVLFTPTAAGEATTTMLNGSELPITWNLSSTAFALARSAVIHLADEHRAAVEDPALARPAVLRHLLAALLHRVAPVAAGDDDAEKSLTRRYRDLIDAHLRERRDVAWYAARLGCSPRTLTRAVRASSGVGAKRLLDERAVLEAKRLLAHTDLPAARVASRLGFEDAANFATYFRRRVGTSPRDWRRHQRS